MQLIPMLIRLNKRVLEFNISFNCLEKHRSVYRKSLFVSVNSNSVQNAPALSLYSEPEYWFYFVLHSAGAFQGSRVRIAFSWDRSASFAFHSSQVRYLYGSNPFSMAVWIRLNIIALPVAPFGVLANRK